MCFSIFVVDGTVIMTTNYEGLKEGPCPHEHIIVSCSVVGWTLRWTVTDTSLKLNSSNPVTFFAVSQHIGLEQTIHTSTIDLKFYQNDTVVNPTHPSSSRINSEMHFHLIAGEYIHIECTDYNQNSMGRNVTALGMCEMCTFICTCHLYMCTNM